MITCHWRRIARRPAVPVDAIDGVEGSQIKRRDGVDDEPRPVPCGSQSRKLGGNNSS
jgi:hypothetical protein